MPKPDDTKINENQQQTGGANDETNDEQNGAQQTDPSAAILEELQRMREQQEAMQKEISGFKSSFATYVEKGAVVQDDSTPEPTSEEFKLKPYGELDFTIH